MPNPINLQWMKCKSGNWCDLINLDLNSIGNVSGVYVIWHTGQPPKVVRVGQGNIANRLSAHRNDPAITGYRSNGPLRVTWAKVPSHQLDGVERYLADHWHPLVGDAFPVASPIAVNSPW